MSRFVYSFGIILFGLALRFRKVRDYLKECVSVSIIKFLLVPILATSLAYLIGFGHIDNGLPLKVVIILSSMPVAFNALIPPSIYDLDLNLANSCWFFTTALLVLVLPLLLIVINWVSMISPTFYSGCQKNVPIADRFFATTLMPQSFYRNIIMANGIISTRSVTSTIAI